MIKVLIVNTTYTKRNGVTKVITNLINNMDKENLDFTYLSINPPEKELQKWLQNIGFNIVILNRSLSKSISYFNSLRKIVRDNKYDIVHAHGNSATLFLDLYAAKLGGCKNLIAHSHNSTCEEKVIHYIFKPLFNATYTLGMACSLESGRWLFGDRDFIEIKNGIELKKYRFNQTFRSKIREKYGISTKEILLGHVGLFNDQKNHAYLIQIMKMLLEMNSLYRLMLVGEGEFKNQIKETVKSLNIEDKVIFVNPTDVVHEYLSAMDCFVMPSKYEGFPLALIEAQTNGLKCFVSDVITREVNITGTVDFLRLDENKNEWINSIMTFFIEGNWARLQKSDEAINQYSKVGYDVIDEAKKLRGIYEKIVRDN